MKEEQKHVDLVSQQDGCLTVKLSPELSKLVLREAELSNQDVAELIDHTIRMYPYTPSVAYPLGWEKSEHWGQKWAHKKPSR